MKLHLLLIVLTLTTFTGFAQTTAIPDANFEQALIDLGIDTNGLNGNILNADAAAVTGSIPIYSNKNISDLTGIEAFINLTTLTILGNNLTTLDLSNNPLLTNVEIYGNDLTSINLSNNTALSELNLGSNQLNTLDLSNNTALTLLIVSDNQLESLNVKNGNNVNFTTFKASNNPNLLCIQVDDAPYSTTNWTNIDASASFSTDCITTTAIPDANFEQALIDLGIDSNGLNGNILNTDAQSVTTYLDVFNKSISDLTGIEAFTNITELYCNNNNLTTLDLPNNTLLKVVNCNNNNNLTSIDVTQNTALETLECWQTMNLTSLDISNNTELKVLTITFNQISILDISNNTALTKLNADNNLLTSLDISQHIALTELKVKNNQLTSLDASNNTSLTHLNVLNNQLTNLNVRNGNNTNFTIFDTRTNPNLACIQVDDVTYSTTTWTDIDAGASFSVNCQYDDDGDGVTNDQEVTDSTDPSDGCSYLTASQVIGNVTSAWSDLDCDGDGVTNGTEIADTSSPLDGCNFFTASQIINNVSESWNLDDCDQDGITNGNEISDGTEPRDYCDYLVSSQIIANVTSWWNGLDCDGDGVSNGEEITDNTDPQNGCSYLVTSQIIANVSPGWNLQDCDCDAIINGDEIINGTNVIVLPPTAATSQNFCPDNIPTVAELVATGSGIQWYAANTGGTALTSTDALTDATTYYASQSVNSCESPRFGVIVSISIPSAPLGTATQNFCPDNNPTIADLTATGTAIQWYVAATGGSALTSSNALTDATAYYASQTVGSCESSRLEVTVSISLPSAPTGTATQSFCPDSNPTVADLAATGSNIKWYAAATGGSALVSSTVLSNGNYYASQIISSCESARLKVTVAITTTSVPTGEDIQSFCADNNSTIANIDVTGTDIKWYDAATGGTALATTTALTNTNTYYASQTLNGCESDRFKVTVVINDTTAPTADATQSFCKEENPTISDLIASGNNLQWYANTTGGTALASNVTLTDATNYYVSQTVSSCESGRLMVEVSITNPIVPTGAATQSFCSVDNSTIAELSATGSNIQWYANATGGSVLATSLALTNAATYYASQTNGNCESDRLAISVTITNIEPPTGESSQIFCFDNPTAVITIAQLEVTGSNVQWYATSTGATPFTSATTLVDGTNYYGSQTIDGCESERFKVTVSNNERIAPSGDFNQSFCKEDNAAVADLVVVGTNILWYDAVTGGNILPGTDVLVSNMYYASQTINECESYRMAVTVRVTDPELPSSTTTQSFCINDNPTVANLEATATGTEIYWYNTPTGGSALALTEALTTANYYVGQIISNCESPRLEVAITVNNTDAPSAEVSQAFCVNDNPTIANLEASGSNLLWYNSQEGGNELPSTQVLQSGPYFVSQTVAECESNRFEVSVTVNESTCETVTSILQYDQLNISTYPSPTNGNLFIDLGKKYHSIKLIIRDVEGMIVENSTYTATNKINVRIKGATGIYFVQVLIPEGKSKIFRILKN